MDEKDLLALWNQLRKNFVNAQFIPVLVFVVLINQAIEGNLIGLPDNIKYFILVIVGIIGLLTFINQYSSIREAMSIIKDINSLKKKSALATKISNSQPYLNLTAIAITGFSLLSYALLIWTLFQ